MAHAVTNSAGASTGSLKTYAIGFLLSVMLTAFAFALVMKAGSFPRGVVIAGIVVAAVMQILVQLHYFLHLDASSEARWNVLAFIFTLFIIFLFVGGTLWIMYDLNARMM